jgi:hypothetical protein
MERVSATLIKTLLFPAPDQFPAFIYAFYYYYYLYTFIHNTRK